MADISIPELMYTAASLLFLLLGTVLLVSILMSTINPYDSIAFANVEKIRSAMDQVCYTGQPVSGINFELPQNTPAFSSLITVMPIWIISNYGDPKYTIYYESFTPGDATGWEVYHIMQNRLVVPLPQGYGDGTKNFESVNDYMRDVLNSWKSKQKLEGVIINNIVLGEGQKPTYYLGGQISSSSAPGGSGGGRSGGAGASAGFEAPPIKIGEWKLKDEKGVVDPGPNQYQFDNYRGLSSFEKTAIKYQPCGENSLCFKTPLGVYKYPLEHCKGKITGIQMIYDASNAPESVKLARFGVNTAEIASWKIIIKVLKSSVLRVLAAPIAAYLIISGTKDAILFLVDVKIGDFNVVSPCSLKDIKIEKGPCNDYSYSKSNYLTYMIGAGRFPPCERVITYPLYEYDSGGKLKEVGSHTACVEKIGDSMNGVTSLGGYNAADQCLQISASQSTGYCWSKDAYKEGFSLLSISEIVRALNEIVGINPIRDNTALLDVGGNKAVVLFPTDIALKKGMQFFEALGRKWWWGWPG